MCLYSVALLNITTVVLAIIAIRIANFALEEKTITAFHAQAHYNMCGIRINVLLDVLLDILIIRIVAQAV